MKRKNSGKATIYQKKMLVGNGRDYRVLDK